ncbi:hypothetical protein NA57DRAFT_56113 [Rhizodiscina lignyota]|uniref:Uncharacterized protein n=1 Tax=Rhizodiscina lignyota TaxID=1504668 RepID=A0A9P4M8K6_9PEZI|nr:hypothetical protein NA57DRAFT_56113 [Rhizodiscina lignyota]
MATKERRKKRTASRLIWTRAMHSKWMSKLKKIRAEKLKANQNNDLEASRGDGVIESKAKGVRLVRSMFDKLAIRSHSQPGHIKSESHSLSPRAPAQTEERGSIDVDNSSLPPRDIDRGGGYPQPNSLEIEEESMSHDEVKHGLTVELSMYVELKVDGKYSKSHHERVCIH